MSEQAATQPPERLPFSNTDLQRLSAITGHIDETCRVYQDPNVRAQMLGTAIGDAVRISREQEDTSPVLSAALVAEAFGAAPTPYDVQGLRSYLDQNKNISRPIKTHLVDTLDTKFRLLGQGAPEHVVAGQVIDMVGGAYSSLQHEEQSDPSVDNSAQILAVMAFAAGATAGQPQFAATEQFMRHAYASVNSEA